MEGWRRAGAVSLCFLELKIAPFYFWKSIPGPVWGFSSPPGKRDSPPIRVSSFPRLGGKGLFFHRVRGGSRPRSRLRSWGAPEGGVFVLLALPGPAWAAGSGRPRLRTRVTGYCGSSASSSPVPSGPLPSRVGLPALPPLRLRPVQAPGEPEGGRTVSGLGSGSARLR